MFNKIEKETSEKKHLNTENIPSYNTQSFFIKKNTGGSRTKSHHPFLVFVHHSPSMKKTTTPYLTCNKKNFYSHIEKQISSNCILISNIRLRFVSSIDREVGKKRKKNIALSYRQHRQLFKHFEFFDLSWFSYSPSSYYIIQSDSIIWGSENNTNGLIVYPVLLGPPDPQICFTYMAGKRFKGDNTMISSIYIIVPPKDNDLYGAFSCLCLNLTITYIKLNLYLLLYIQIFCNIFVTCNIEKKAKKNVTKFHD